MPTAPAASLPAVTAASPSWASVTAPAARSALPTLPSTICLDRTFLLFFAVFSARSAMRSARSAVWTGSMRAAATGAARR